MSQLTTQHTRLRDLEIVIEEGKQTFIAVGNALAEIKEQELYKLTHGTFADYCKERWGFNKAYANHVIRAAEVVSSLPAGAATIVATESQARELQKVEACKRVEVLEKAQAVAKSEDRALTAKDIANAAPAKPTPAYVAPVEPEPEPEPVATMVAKPSKRTYSPETFRTDVGGSVDLVLAEFTIEEQKKAAGELEMLAAKIRHNIRKATLNP